MTSVNVVSMNHRICLEFLNSIIDCRYLVTWVVLSITNHSKEKTISIVLKTIEMFGNSNHRVYQSSHELTSNADAMFVTVIYTVDDL